MRATSRGAHASLSLTTAIGRALGRLAHAQLTLVMMSVVPVIAISAVIYGRYLQNLQKRFQDELANATTVAEEGTHPPFSVFRFCPSHGLTVGAGHGQTPAPAHATVISNIRTMRAFSKEERSSEQYGAAVHKRFESTIGRTAGMLVCVAATHPHVIPIPTLGWPCWNSYEIGSTISLMYGAFNGIIGFVPQAAIAMVLWYGGKLTIDGVISTGGLTSFLLYTLSVAAVRAEPMENTMHANLETDVLNATWGANARQALAFISSLFGDFMAAVGATERIFTLLDRKPEIHTKGYVARPGSWAVVSWWRCRMRWGGGWGGYDVQLRGSLLRRGRSRTPCPLLDWSTCHSSIARRDNRIVHSGLRLPQFKGEVEFKDVSFVYPARCVCATVRPRPPFECADHAMCPRAPLGHDCRPDQSVLKNVDLKMHPGQVLALVGPSGTLTTQDSSRRALGAQPVRGWGGREL